MQGGLGTAAERLYAHFRLPNGNNKITRQDIQNTDHPEQRGLHR